MGSLRDQALAQLDYESTHGTHSNSLKLTLALTNYHINRHLHIHTNIYAQSKYYYCFHSNECLTQTKKGKHEPLTLTVTLTN